MWLDSARTSTCGMAMAATPGGMADSLKQVLATRPGLKAGQLRARLERQWPGVSRGDINRVLFQRKDLFQQVEDYRWTLRDGGPASVPAAPPPAAAPAKQPAASRPPGAECPGCHLPVDEAAIELWRGGRRVQMHRGCHDMEKRIADAARRTSAAAREAERLRAAPSDEPRVPTRQCAACGAICRADAAVCKACRRMLPTPGMAHEWD
jgi:hypothetical protein